MEANLYDLVQFVPEHKWGGCYGFISEKKVYDTDTKYMIGVPVPQQGTAYIYSMESEKEFEVCGKAIFIPADSDE